MYSIIAASSVKSGSNLPAAMPSTKAERPESIAASARCSLLIMSMAVFIRDPLVEVVSVAHADQLVEQRLIRGKRFAGALIGNTATLQHDRLARERQDLVRVLFDQDHRHAALAHHLVDDAQQFLRDQRRQPFERLVEQQQLGIG